MKPQQQAIQAMMCKIKRKIDIYNTIDDIEIIKEVIMSKETENME